MEEQKPQYSAEPSSDLIETNRLSGQSRAFELTSFSVEDFFSATQKLRTIDRRGIYYVDVRAIADTNVIRASSPQYAQTWFEIPRAAVKELTVIGPAYNLGDPSVLAVAIEFKDEFRCLSPLFQGYGRGRDGTEQKFGSAAEQPRRVLGGLVLTEFVGPGRADIVLHNFADRSAEVWLTVPGTQDLVHLTTRDPRFTFFPTEPVLIQFQAFRAGAYDYQAGAQRSDLDAPTVSGGHFELYIGPEGSEVRIADVEFMTRKAERPGSLTQLNAGRNLIICDARQTWTTYGLFTNALTKLTVQSIENTWSFNPARPTCGWEGSATERVAKDGYPLPGLPEGILVGRVGEAGATVVQVQPGTQFAQPLAQTPVYLVINDDLAGRYGAGLNDNSGFLRVTIEVSN